MNYELPNIDRHIQGSDINFSSEFSQGQEVYSVEHTEKGKIDYTELWEDYDLEGKKENGITVYIKLDSGKVIAIEESELLEEIRIQIL